MPTLAHLAERCDAIAAGPAMTSAEAGSRLAARLLGLGPKPLVLDAAVLMGLAPHEREVSALPQPAVLTPHLGELAAMLGCAVTDITDDRAAAVLTASERYGAICLCKGATTLIAAPDGSLFAYAGGGVGLATGGSGDIMAGIVAGLCARGATALEATLWAVWLHGEAGRRCAEQIGPLGFLARELLAHVPALLRAV